VKCVMPPLTTVQRAENSFIVGFRQFNSNGINPNGNNSLYIFLFP